MADLYSNLVGGGVAGNGRLFAFKKAKTESARFTAEDRAAIRAINILKIYWHASVEIQRRWFKGLPIHLSLKK